MAEESQIDSSSNGEYIPVVRGLLGKLSEEYANKMESTPGKIAFNLNFLGDVVRASIGYIDDRGYVPLKIQSSVLKDIKTPHQIIFDKEIEHLDELSGYLTGMINQQEVRNGEGKMRFRDGTLETFS